MKITRSRLKQIIKEEFAKTLKEEAADLRQAYIQFGESPYNRDLSDADTLESFLNYYLSSIGLRRPAPENLEPVAELYKEFIAPGLDLSAEMARTAEELDDAPEPEEYYEKSSDPRVYRKGEELRSRRAALKRKLELLKLVKEMP